MGGNFGAAAGFLLGPYVIGNDSASVAHLLWVENAMALLLFLCVIVYCPIGPRIPLHHPSTQYRRTPEELRQDCGSGSADDAVVRRSILASSSHGVPPSPSNALSSAVALHSHCAPETAAPADAGPSSASISSIFGSFVFFLRGLVSMVSSPSLLVLAFFGGVQAGVSSGWSGVLPQILVPPAYSDVFAGWCGFATCLAGVAGNVGAGVLGDRFFPTRLKELLVALYLLSALFFGLFALCLPSPISSSSLFPSSHASVLLLIIFAGFFQSACDPLFYELAAEISYPLPEGTSAGLITLLFNASTLVLLFVAPAVSANVFNVVMCLAMLLGGIGTWVGVRQIYLRRSAEGRMPLKN